MQGLELHDSEMVCAQVSPVNPAAQWHMHSLESGSAMLVPPLPQAQAAPALGLESASTATRIHARVDMARLRKIKKLEDDCLDSRVTSRQISNLFWDV